MKHVHIAADFASWRDKARTLLNAEIPPDEIIWSDDRQPPMLAIGDDAIPELPVMGTFRVPPDFVAMAKLVACHRDPERWSLLYRVLWRIVNEHQSLLKNAVDADVGALESMHRSVRRDRHKMTAFVRFRNTTIEGSEWFVAWYRPDHFIVSLVKPFFCERFAAMKFAIMTPDDSLTWDGESAEIGPGVPAPIDVGDDDFESMWKLYYASIFNPARIKLKAMRKEMPVRYWPTMPETQLIPELLADAPRRVRKMVEQQAAMAARPADPTLLPAGASSAKIKLSLPQVPDTDSLEAVRDAAMHCRACDWAEQCTQTVFGDGPANSRIMFVGEQPGDIEDQRGQPFVGPAGQLLTEVFEEVGIDRSAVYMTNAVKHFKFEPRGKRRIHKTPSARDVSICNPWLQAEIKIVKPKLLIALGATAGRALFGNGFRVTQSRGSFFKSDIAEESFATFHPSMLLRIPDADMCKESMTTFKSDLKAVKRAIAAL